MIQSERIYLRLFDEKDVPLRVKWMNDPEIREMLNAPYPVSEQSTKKWLASVLEDSARIDFAICMKETDCVIGYTGFRNIDLINNKAESYTGLGETKYWGKGYAKESKIAALSYIFKKYNLNKVYALIWSKHTRSIEMNKRIGYRVDGVLREDLYSNGEYRDMVIMSLLRDEFLKRTDT